MHQTSGRKPLIQSSWGHATPEERLNQGKSRGGPSNKHGHLHVLDLDPTEQLIELQDNLLAREKLNHFGPWNALTHQAISGPTARILGNIVHDALMNNGVTSEAFADFHFGANGTSAYSYGYRLHFDQPIGFGEAFDCLAAIANSFEVFYQNVTTLHSDFYKHPAAPDIQSIARYSLVRRATEFGFTNLEAEKLASFVLSIRPTYGQVRNWHRELLANGEDPDSLDIMDKLMGRYERVAHALGSLTDNYPAYLNLIRDTVLPPEQFREIQSVWPVHLGASFVIDDYAIKGGKLAVYSISLMPNIDTVKGIEYVAGALLKRAKGSNA